MKIEEFAQNLSGLYVNWDSPDVSPKDSKFKRLLESVNGMTSPSVLQVLNFAVTCREYNETYLEVGSLRGATLIGAMLGEDDRNGWGVDNFSEFNFDGQNESQLFSNLAHHGVQDRVRFENRCFVNFFNDPPSDLQPIGVYFYDGAHDYQSQIDGLNLVVPLLAKRALLIVDDSNKAEVKMAVNDFLIARKEAKLLFEFPSPENAHRSFWNGLTVLSWDG